MDPERAPALTDPSVGNLGTQSLVDRSAVMKELHAMLGVRLFGNGPWLAGGEAALSIGRKLQSLGLEEVIDRGTRPTILGRELKLDLIEVFLGIFYEGEVPWILEEHGLLDSETAEDLMARRTSLKMRKAFCGRSSRMHSFVTLIPPAVATEPMKLSGEPAKSAGANALPQRRPRGCRLPYARDVAIARLRRSSGVECQRKSASFLRLIARPPTPRFWSQRWPCPLSVHTAS